MNGKDGDGQRNRDSPQQEAAMKRRGMFLFGLLGATAASTLLVGRLRRAVDWFYTQLGRSRLSWKGTTGGSFRSSFKEEAQKRYNRRMQEEYEEEMERVERIRRVQSVFNRGQNKYKRTYESWRENGPGEYHHHHFQREDWYWKTDASQGHRRTSFRETPQDSASYLLSHHYSVLGLDRLRKIPYTDNEIKTAFRAKAKEFHPDQNQDNKELAEAKFKEVMTSYEAIKMERKTIKR